MSRIRFIEHRCRRILRLDCSRIADLREALVVIAESRLAVATEPTNGGLLTLTLVADSHFDSSVLKAIRDVIQHNRPYVRAAVVGLRGLMRVVCNTLVLLTGRNIRVFADAACAYLVAEATAVPPT